MKTKIAMTVTLLAALAACDEQPRTGTTAAPLVTMIGGQEPETMYQLFDDFHARGQMECTNCVYTAEPEHPGIAVFSSENTARARAIPEADGNTMTFSGTYSNATHFRMTYKLEALANETDDYVLAFGFCDTGVPPCNNGAWVEHTSAADGWICKSAENPSTDTQTDEVAIDVGVWHQISFWIDPSTPYFQVAVDGMSSCWTDAAIPDTAAVTPFISMTLVDGESVDFLVDFLSVDQTFYPYRDHD